MQKSQFTANGTMEYVMTGKSQNATQRQAGDTCIIKLKSSSLRLSNFQFKQQALCFVFLTTFKLLVLLFISFKFGFKSFALRIKC